MRGLEDDQASGVPQSHDSAVSFDVFYEQRWPWVVRLAHAVVGSQAVGEELAQDAFISTHRVWESLENPDAFVRVAVLNLARSRLRRQRLEVSRFPPPRPGAVPEPALDETWQALTRLPYRQRAVLALRYYADLPEHEIAELLGCRLGTVKSAHHRALRRLRKELS